MKTKFFSWILLAATLISLIACSNVGGSETTTSSVSTSTSEETVAETQDVLPVKKYNNEDYIVLVTNRSDDYKSREFKAVETNGETLNDAVYARNLKIEETYEINIVNTPMSNEADVLRNSVKASDTAYDLALIRLDAAGPLGIDGHLADFNQMPYLKLDGDWWDTNSVKDLSIGGKLFITVGDMNICDKDMTWCFFFDKGLATDKKLPNLFKLASEKKWTFDKLSELCKDVTSDLNGDSVLDGNDVWGHVTVFARSTIAYMYSMDTFYIVKDNDDLPVIQIDDKVNNTYEKIISFFSSDNMCMDIQALDKGEYAHQWRKAEAMFMNHQILFYAEAMQNAERFRNADNDFGILPIPSAEEGKYGLHMVWKQAYVTVFPGDIVSNADFYDRDCLILEAIQRASSEIVLPAYYDIALKNRFARDSESSAMIDIIFDNKYYDIASYYGWGNLSGTIQTLGQSLSSNFSSSIKMIQKIAEKDISKTIDSLNGVK